MNRKATIFFVILILAGLVVWGCGQSQSSGSAFNEGETSPSIKEVYLPNNESGTVLLTPGQSINISVEATDDDPIGYVIKWSVTGGALSSTTGESVVYTAPSSWGAYSLSVSAIENPDGSGDGSGYSFNILVSPWKYINTGISSYTYWPAFSAIDYHNDNSLWVAGWDDVYKYNGTDWISQEVSFIGHLDCLSVVSTNDIWAFGWYFGQAGIYCHYDGNEWKDGDFVPPPNGADFAASNDGWIVANNGVIMHWNGSTWEGSSSSTTNNLNSVVAKANIFVWAVGDNGSILRFLGLVWENYASPTTENLNDIVFNSSNDGWIVGDNGTILHFDGTSWSSVASPTTVDLISIAFRTSNEGWIVGKDGYKNTILYYDGTSWQKLFELNSGYAISDVTFSSNNSGWMVGNMFLKYEP